MGLLSTGQSEVIVHANPRKSTHAPRDTSVRSYTEDEIDAVAIYCGELYRRSILPITGFSGQGMIHLRLGSARDAERAAVNWADDLDPWARSSAGRAPSGTQEVAGSSPVAPLIERASWVRAVGADEFRNHFGYYMERAAAGAEILITCRGKPQPASALLQRASRSSNSRT